MITELTPDEQVDPQLAAILPSSFGLCKKTTLSLSHSTTPFSLVSDVIDDAITEDAITDDSITYKMYQRREARTHGSAFTRSALLSLSSSSSVTSAINSGRGDGDVVVFTSWGPLPRPRPVWPPPPL
ncbi:hypothetical protein ACLB2K_071402 [Fragaria x ananassa]